jgi:mannosyltransferase OCH1-like enzyme
MAIPKIIHQCFVQKDNLPQPILEVQNILMNLNPDWEYRLYDDQDMLDFIEDNYDSKVLRSYNKINPLYGAARADFFRYLLIHKVGGAYFDIKSYAARPLNNIIDGHDYVLSHWISFPTGKWGMSNKYPYGEFQQWHVIGAPGHPFLKAVIERVMENIENYSVEKHGVAKLGVLILTGPKVYTEAINPLTGQHNHKWYKTNDEAGLVYSIMQNFVGHVSLFPVSHPHYSQIVAPIVFHDDEEMRLYKEHVVSRLLEISKNTKYG